MKDVMDIDAIAKMLGVSRQTLYVRRVQPDFPNPAIVLAVGPLWWRTDIERYVEARPKVAGGSSEVWTKETVIEAIREFNRRYGRPPRATDWNPAQARRLGHPERADRFYEDACWPHLQTVMRKFGTWGYAIESAGFPRPLPGHYETERRRAPKKRRREQILAGLAGGGNS